jgi:hypothetical protein
MHERRGMLLLLVLSMLTLFLMMGATLLVVATRARTAARAFMNATSGLESSPVIPRSFLDEALLILIRGSKAPAVNELVTESLLKDMYGDHATVNRVPFRDEQADAFSSANPFLTQIEPDGSVRKAAFQGDQPDGNIEVDNDGDGEPDGVWLPEDDSVEFLPKVTSTSGGSLKFKVSYLVRDLDGRINVNAHGGAGGGDPLGPAAIDASDLEAFAGDAWAILQNGGTPGARDPEPDHVDLREPPKLGQAIPGRGGAAYGLRLDRNATPIAGSPVTDAQPFTLGELERVLRPFDRDWSTLPPRLSAILAHPDHAARETVTTDSWDVPYTTGSAAPPEANPAPERKFDLTIHPGGTQAAKQAFARALFEFIAPAPAANPPRTQIAPRDQATAQWCANVAEFREPGSPAEPLTVDPTTDPPLVVTGAKPSDLREHAGSWTGGLASSGDLLAIPKGTKTEIDEYLDAPDPKPPLEPLKSLVPSRPAILDAVHVPTRFRDTFDADPVREPGRVNVNTCNGDVWNAVSGPDGPPQPETPVLSLWELLAASVLPPPADPERLDVRKVDPGKRQVANRLASMATVRSNVFAVWITLEVTDTAVTAGAPTCYRLFAIVDRSIPVDFKQGENTNVHETIRLKRFLN